MTNFQDCLFINESPWCAELFALLWAMVNHLLIASYGLTTYGYRRKKKAALPGGKTA